MGFQDTAKVVSPLRSPAFVRWTFGNVAIFSGHFWVMVSLASYFAVTVGVFASVLVFSVMEGLGCIGAPVGGVLADRHSPGSVVRFTSVCQVVSYVALAGAFIFSAPLLLTMLCLAAVGFFHNVAWPPAGIFRHSVLSDEQLERGAGILNVTEVAGIVLGSLSAAFILPGTVYLPIAAGALGCLLRAGSTLGVPAPPGHASLSGHHGQEGHKGGFADLVSGWRETYRSRFVFLAIVGSTLPAFIPVFALQASKVNTLDLSGFTSTSVATLIGIVTMVSSAAAAVAAYVFSILVRRKHIATWLLASLFINVVSCVIWFSVSVFYALLAMAIFNAATVTVSEAAADLAIHTAAPAHIRGRAYGLWISVISLAQLAPTAFVGYLVGLYGFGFLFIPAAFVTVLIAALIVKFRALESPYASVSQEDVVSDELLAA